MTGRTGRSVRTALLAAMGAAFKLGGLLVTPEPAWMGTGASILAFGGIGLAVGVILLLLFLAMRRGHGGSIPSWSEALLADRLN